MYYSIRPMNGADCAAVATLSGQLGYPASETEIRARFESITARSAGVVLVAENDGSLIGWIHAAISPVLEADLYGEICAVSFVGRERDELKFDGLEPLMVQMRKDESEARALLAGVQPLSEIDRRLNFA